MVLSPSSDVEEYDKPVLFSLSLFLSVSLCGKSNLR